MCLADPGQNIRHYSSPYQSSPMEAIGGPLQILFLGFEASPIRPPSETSPATQPPSPTRVWRAVQGCELHRRPEELGCSYLMEIDSRDRRTIAEHERGEDSRSSQVLRDAKQELLVHPLLASAGIVRYGRKTYIGWYRPLQPAPQMSFRSARFFSFVQSPSLLQPSGTRLRGN